MKIITLTLSPCIDTHCYVEELELGKENIARTSSADVGGKGINISRALCSCGVENTAVIALAARGGADIRFALEREGIPYRAVEYAGGVRNNITVHSKDSAETRISFDAAVEDGAELLSKISAELRAILGGGDVLAVAGSVPSGVDVDALCRLLADLSERGVRIVIDSRSFGISQLSRVRPWFIKPNEQEIRGYLGREACSGEEALEAARELRALGIENVMVTLGSRGAALCCEDGEFCLRAPYVKVRSTVGAGDSAIAGFLSAVNSGHSKKRALEMAVCYGSAACMREGTAPPVPSDIKLLLDSLADIEK